MYSRNGCALLALMSVAWLLTPIQTTLAKPPDLPIDLKVRCEEATRSETGHPAPVWNVDVDLFSWRVSVDVRPTSPGPNTSFGATCLQACVPVLFHSLCERLAHVGHEAARGAETAKRTEGQGGAGRREEAARGGRKVGADVDSVMSDRERQAHTMFKIAERCHRNGDLAKARTCYEETHLLWPNSRVGREAMRRLADIDGGRGVDLGLEEESSIGTEDEPPLYRDPLRSADPESRRHEEMLRNTQPLGTVSPNWIYREAPLH